METVKQKTLKGSFSLFGKGLHTGLSLTVTFNPAPENTGYKIQRIDLDGQPIIDAVAENVVDTQRGTVLAKGEARVSTIEHGMSALYAMGIDNCLIQINGPEFPILDGSATMYVDKINEVGIVDQNAPKDYYIIRKKIEIKDKNGSVITILPDEQFSITAMCNFDSKFISSQFARWMILTPTQPRLRQHVPSFLYVILCRSCRLTLLKVVTWIMPLLSMSSRFHKRNLTSWPTLLKVPTYGCE